MLIVNNGSQVKFKSGGPSMRVIAVNGSQVKVSWTENQQLREQWVDESQLVEVGQVHSQSNILFG